MVMSACNTFEEAASGLREVLMKSGGLALEIRTNDCGFMSVNGNHELVTVMAQFRQNCP
jgi:hypothetical protein